MLLTKDIKEDIKAARQIRLPWWLLLGLGIGSLPMYWLFDHFGRFGLALPAVDSILVVAFTIAVKWKLRRKAWFWGTMAILALLHVLLILCVPWPTKWVPALAIAAVGSADVIVMLAILALVERFMNGPKAAASDSGD